ncbi:hypothetical protein J3A83DRAFT_4196575 [Scleroderma citrinum]
MASRGNFKGMGLVVPLFLRSIALTRFNLHIKLVGGEKALQGFVHQKWCHNPVTPKMQYSLVECAEKRHVYGHIRVSVRSATVGGALEHGYEHAGRTGGVGDDEWMVHMSATDTQGLPGVWTVYLDVEWLYVNCCEVEKSFIKVHSIYCLVICLHHILASDGISFLQQL